MRWINTTVIKNWRLKNNKSQYLCYETLIYQRFVLVVADITKNYIL